MRITSGKLKGDLLYSKKKKHVRPTMQKTKEALFSILYSKGFLNEDKQQSLRIIDLFCGLGTVSLEFISREIGMVTCVDKNYANITFIRNTLEKFDYEKKAQLICADIFRWVSKNNRTEKDYDILFLDPPYQINSRKIRQLITDLFDFGYVSAHGMLILEHTKALDIEESWSFFSEKRNYGTTCLSFFKQSI